MLLQQTIEKLYDLRLPAMATTLEQQVQNGDCNELSFVERFGMLVDQEWFRRYDKRLQRRIKDARLRVNACVEDIDYRHPRGLNRETFADLITCRWVRAHRNVLMCGPTGIGKTWLACAIAQKVCREGFTVAYIRVPRLLHELKLAQADGSYLRQLRKIAKKDLLVLDDIGLSALPGDAGNHLLEVLDDRVGSRSTLVTSQLPAEKWHELVDEPTVADAILDRLLGGSIQINLKGESMR